MSTGALDKIAEELRAEDEHRLVPEYFSLDDGPAAAPRVEDSVAVPVGYLRGLLACVRRGLIPQVAWNEDRQRMDAAAMFERGEVLKELEEKLGNLLLGS